MNHIRHLLTLLSIIISLSLTAQVPSGPPDIQWQHCYGGTLDDVGYGITSTSDGGYLFVGCSGSSDGDILFGPNDEQYGPNGEMHGGTCDYWGEKIDANFNTQFKFHYGGTGTDVPYSALETPDGNYIIAGNTGSTDVDVSGNHGDLDYWIMKINSTPSIIWKKCYGGLQYDDYGSIINTSDGNIAFCGGTSSGTTGQDGDVSGNHGSSDFWLVKADQNGNILWQKCYGGTDYEKAYDLKQCTDGGYVLAGFTASNNGDVSGNHSADYDGWIIKTDANGNLQWQKCVGGTSQDGFFKVVVLNDQNILAAGYESSTNDDITNNHGDDDGWLALLSPEGNLLWSKAFGGDSVEGFYDIRQDQLGEIEVAGYTRSSNDDISFNHGGKDYWLMGVDEDGNILWDTVYGGTYDEVCYAMTGSGDGGIVLNGYTISNDGDVSGNHDIYHVKKDYWVLKLETVVGIHEIQASDLNIIPTLTNSIIQISLEDYKNLNATVTIRNSTNSIVKMEKVNHQSKMLVDVSSFAQGIYFVEISDETKMAIGKFVKW